MPDLRWGLIGCGDISKKRVAPALRDTPGSALLAVSRRRGGLAAAFGAEFGAQRHYDDWRDMLRDPEVGAIYVATPVYLHAEQAIAAAEAGKHVLCEKPMALTAADCDRMIEACRAAGVRLSVAYYRRFYPVLQRIRELLASGELGQPVLAQINAFENYNPAPDDPRHWFVEKRQAGGGPMMDFGCHRIEVLLSLLGNVRNVRASLDGLRYEREVEDTAVVDLRFENPVRAIVTVTHAALESQDTLDLFCTEGSLHVAVLNRGELTVRTAAGDRVEKHPPHANLHQPLVEDFIKAVQERREPTVTGETGREVQEILDRVYEEDRA